MYYDSEYEIKKREEFNNIDNLVTNFLNRIVDYRIKREYNEIERILIGYAYKDKKIYKYYSESYNKAKYIDENSIINMRVWTDEKTKELLKVLYYVCRSENEIITLNNKIISLWLFETNTEMSEMFYEMKEIKCNHKYRLSFKVEKELWKELVKRCKLLSATVPEGFKACVNDFIEQKAKQYP